MATILKAGNATTGLSLTPDSTGILELKTGTGSGTTAVTISTAQDVTLAGAASVAGNLSFNSGYGSAAVAYGCRAWVNFTGSTGGIRGSGNVTSVTRSSAGQYIVNFTTAMVDTNYSTVVTAGNSSGTGQTSGQNYAAAAPTTGAVRIYCATNGVGPADPAASGLMNCSVFR